MDISSRYRVPGLVRGLNTLKLFTPERPTLTLSEIAAALGVTRSAAFRTVFTLSEMGCLLQDETTKRYTLGPEVIRLSHGYAAMREVLEVAEHELEDLHAETGWSVHLGVLDGISVLYLIRIAGAACKDAIVRIGSRLPARSTTLGRVLLAHTSEQDLIARFRADAGPDGRVLSDILRRARKDRLAEYIMHAGDFEAGILSAAAPIRDKANRVLAAVSVTSPTSPEMVKQLNDPIGDALTSKTRKISRMLGWKDMADQ